MSATSNKPIVLPALRGEFGNWIYYSCHMPVGDLGTRVQYAEEIHTSKALSDLIQRVLEGPRARRIAGYIANTEDRFFNSLVVATYGGNPDWLEVGNYRPSAGSEALALVPEASKDSVGFLSFSGEEKMFAIDGQHRLAGIREAIARGVDLADQQVPVVLVGHKTDAAGMRRTRRLFTTLNKTAVPVAKRDIIALDEDDVMAITARRLVEGDPRFAHPKIAVISAQNVPLSNRTCLTTIANLYDILKILFRYDVGKKYSLGERPDRMLRFNRPSDEVLEHYFRIADEYLSRVGLAFPEVGRLYETAADEKAATAVTELYRGPQGGHLAFRPFGFQIIAQVAIDLVKHRGLALTAAVDVLSGLPTDLASEPFKGVLWDADRHRIIVGGKALALQIVRYMVGLGYGQDLLVRYRAAIGCDPDDASVQLPLPLVQAPG